VDGEQHPQPRRVDVTDGAEVDHDA
jgi:hypothetical protein